MLDIPSISHHPDEDVRNRMNLALDYLKKENIEEARSLLERNVEKGCTDSMVLLGTLLSNGTEPERKESIGLFRRASVMGNDSGMRNLAYCYAIGLNTEKDKKMAAELYIKSAENGNPRAACNIGVMMDFGNGVPQDREGAFKWYLRSAEGGYPRGMTNLGEFYMLGKGTEKDIAQAIRWFERSGSPRATYHLYEIYLTEDGYKDAERGYDCLRRSAEMGYSKGMVHYAQMIDPDDHRKAVELYRSAASKGNSDAVTYLESHGLKVPEPRRRKKTS